MVASLTSIGSAHRLGEGSALEDLSVIDASIDKALLLRAEVLIEWIQEHEAPEEPDQYVTLSEQEQESSGATPPASSAEQALASNEASPTQGAPRLTRTPAEVLFENPTHIAGEGAPSVSDFALVELAATLRRSVASTSRLVGGVCELAFRLPQIWERTRGGNVGLWRALRVAEKTQSLPWTAAREVDVEIVSVLGSCSWAHIDRCIQAALVRAEEAMHEDDPARSPEAEESLDKDDGTDPERNASSKCGEDEADIEARKLQIRLQEAGTDPWMLGAAGIGLTSIEGLIDDADALDLEAAIRELAAKLAKAGSTEPLDVRRAKAIGLLARGEVPVPKTTNDTSGEPDPTASGPDSPDPHSSTNVATEPALTGAAPGTNRRVRLVVHLTDTALVRNSGVGRCENTLAPASVQQIKQWCAGSRIQVQPVLDIAEHQPVGRYEIPDRLRAQVHDRDLECAFPHCHTPARSCDLDHVIPYPEGPTCACNLVPLCRRHHRAKTARRWSYVMVHPGCYFWHSPSGTNYLVDSNGTHTLPDLSEAGVAARFRRPCISDISDRVTTNAHPPDLDGTQRRRLPRRGRQRAPERGRQRAPKQRQQQSPRRDQEQLPRRDRQQPSERDQHQAPARRRVPV